MRHTDPEFLLRDSIGYLAALAHRVLSNAANKRFALEGVDVTAEQWSLLVLLWNDDGQSPRVLAERSCKDRTNVTRLLDGLEKRELVRRTTDSADRRHKRVYLTEKGRELQAKLTCMALDVRHEALKDIPEEHVKICKDVIKGIIANLAGYLPEGTELPGEPSPGCCVNGGLSTGR